MVFFLCRYLQQNFHKKFKILNFTKKKLTTLPFKNKFDYLLLQVWYERKNVFEFMNPLVENIEVLYHCDKLVLISIYAM